MDDPKVKTWYRILLHMPRQSLWTMRLVCKTSREAAVMHIHSLTVTDGTLPGKPLEECLMKFPGIDTLILKEGSIPAWPTLLTESERLTQLTAITVDAHIEGRRAVPVRSDPAGTALTNFLAHCTNLKSLNLLVNVVSLNLSDVVRSCPGLCKLACDPGILFNPRLDVRNGRWPPIRQLTALQELTLGLCDSKPLLPLYWQMRQLRALSEVPIDNPEDVRYVAALTQLTSVAIWVDNYYTWSQYGMSWVEGLRPLTGLVKLSLVTDGWWEGLGGVVSAMPGLAELCLDFNGRREEDDDVLAWDFKTFSIYQFPYNLTALDIKGIDVGVSLSRFMQHFFSDLRRLSLRGVQCEEDPAFLVAGLFADFTRIQNLDLKLEVFEVVPYLSALTGLTRLVIYVRKCRALGRPTFLSTLVRLRILELRWSLHGMYVEQFTSCFTRLHDLESLTLKLRPPPWGRPVDCNSSVLGMHQLWPLLSLRLLEVFYVTEPWTIEQDVVDSWQQIRQMMGVRPLRLAR
jgi:hypothetical protein